MDNSLKYSEILKKTVQEAASEQPSLQPIRLYPVCDLESGHFLVLATSRSKKSWFDSILFHARLITEDNSDRQSANHGRQQRSPSHHRRRQF